MKALFNARLRRRRSQLQVTALMVDYSAGASGFDCKDGNLFKPFTILVANVTFATSTVNGLTQC